MKHVPSANNRKTNVLLFWSFEKKSGAWLQIFKIVFNSTIFYPIFDTLVDHLGASS